MNTQSSDSESREEKRISVITCVVSGIKKISMGNSLGRKTTEVMKINGETFKLKTPVRAEEVVKDYPAGYVLLESEAVKHFGIRAKPLQPHQHLQPKRLYLLVELPEAPREIVPRRVRSGINMSAKDRLESLMLARRSVSDLSNMKPVRAVSEEISVEGAMRVKMRLPKAEVERLVKESRNEAEAAEKIVNLYMANGGSGGAPHQVPHWNGSHGRIRGGLKASTKRVSFLPISEGGSQIAVAS